MSRENAEEKHIKQMANLLRQGATMTDLACPECSSPLFKLRSGDMWCAKCEKKAIVLKEGERAPRTNDSMVLDTLETTLLAKVQEMQDKMQQEKSVEELQKLSNTLSELLKTLEKLREVRRIG